MIFTRENWWLTPQPLPAFLVTPDDIEAMIREADDTNYQVGRVLRESTRDPFRMNIDMGSELD